MADTVLAKHDEKYMPPEVAAALKKAGIGKKQAENRKQRQELDLIARS